MLERSQILLSLNSSSVFSQIEIRTNFLDTISRHYFLSLDPFHLKLVSGKLRITRSSDGSPEIEVFPRPLLLVQGYAKSSTQ